MGEPGNCAAEYTMRGAVCYISDRRIRFVPRVNWLFMDRRTFLAGLGGGAACAQSSGSRRPNFLVIFSDDQGWNDVGCFGSEIT